MMVSSRKLSELDQPRPGGTGPVSFQPKGKPPQRQCPADFDVIFVEKGRDGCETWYRASRITVNRWLKERGKKALITRRAAYVKHQRAEGKWLTRSSRLVETRPQPPVRRPRPVKDRRRVNPNLARHAAQFLRTVRNGGWIVSPTPQGDWWVGSRRLSPAQMLDLAVGKGFDVKRANQQLKAEAEESFDPAQRLGDFHARQSRIAKCHDAEALALRSDGVRR